MLATILITNYNYASFLSEAIDSALGQEYQHTEVVVVDDGSTDESREIIESYGDRIVPVLQDNQGQAGALNAGFAVARGDIMCMLDSDDIFVPTKVARVVAAYEPGDAVVYHQLQRVDAAGNPQGKPTPRAVMSGDIRRKVARAAGWWPRPVTTGLSFPRNYLERVLPVPVMKERLFIDTYLAGCAPFHGSVRGIAAPLGLNRVHQSNTWSMASVVSGGQETAKARLDRYVLELDVLSATLARTGVDAELNPDDHVRLRQYRWMAGDGASLLGAVGAVVRCPTLPWSMKWREAARTALRRW